MPESPALNLLIGAFLAGIFGVATAVVVELIKNAFRRRTIARAIFTEMIQAINQMLAAVGYLDKLTRYKDPEMNTVPTEIVRMMRPLDRKIVPVLGEAVGYLSSSALSSAVAFEGTMDSESRRMREPTFDEPGSRVTAKELRNRICWSMSLVIDFAEIMANDAFGWWREMGEAECKIIDQARKVAKSGDPPPPTE